MRKKEKPTARDLLEHALILADYINQRDQKETNWIFNEIRTALHDEDESVVTIQNIPDDGSVRYQVEGNSVRLLIDGEVALEYIHPDPWAVLPRLRVLDVTPSPFGDPCRVASVDWSHGSGWVDSKMMRTTFTHRSLLPNG